MDLVLKSFQKNRFHIRIIIKSNDLSNKNNIESTKLIYKILGEEIKKYIHSIQISFNKTWFKKKTIFSVL